MSQQLLNPPKPPESRKTMKPRIELIGTIGREPSDRSPVGADSHVSEPLELLTDETGIIAANQR